MIFVSVNSTHIYLTTIWVVFLDGFISDHDFSSGEMGTNTFPNSITGTVSFLSVLENEKTCTNDGDDSWITKWSPLFGELH